MAILWTHALQTILDPQTLLPAAGARAYFYNAGTSTPRSVFSDATLSTPYGEYVLANSVGRFPAVFLPTGDYRVRVITFDGVGLWDVDNISAPVSTSGGGGGGSTPNQFLYQTGDMKARYGTGPLDGYIRLNAKTLGNAASGATERANADTSVLYSYLWTTDSTLVVSGGRGPNAGSDYASNKTIALPDFRGISIVGLDDMGNTAAGRLTGATSLSSILGAQAVTLDQTQIPTITPTASSSPAPDHRHLIANNENTTNSSLTASNYTTFSGQLSGGGGFSYILGGTATQPTLGLTSLSGAFTPTITVNPFGGGLSHSNVQPSRGVTVYMKL